MGVWLVVVGFRGWGGGMGVGSFMVICLKMKINTIVELTALNLCNCFKRS